MPPGEHTGTFRGNNLTLVSATAALDLYWRDDIFSHGVQRTGEVMRHRLEAIATQYGNRFSVRGRGMALGFDCELPELAATTACKAFEKGLIVERCGPVDQVMKFLPALTIDSETLNDGLEILSIHLTKR
ncbi:aminotransferase class III-fold pyridoxal phosphate-dependent enzyme [Bradyrhizobium sp. RT5a]|uniref:aminotransferase class III-fold pyridoxal phosphate-dependent enzyme n=1 Tax=unclassified Bradyrhizobium TaxID=2631580 RepID=UPI0033996BA4